MTKLGETCKHGSLRRSCETCDLAEQLDEALLKLGSEGDRADAAETLLDAKDNEIKRLSSRLDTAISLLREVWTEHYFMHEDPESWDERVEKLTGTEQPHCRHCSAARAAEKAK